MKLVLNKKANTKKAITLAIDALFTDGSFHKQWYLMEILKTLGVDVNSLIKSFEKDGYYYEEPIAP